MNSKQRLASYLKGEQTDRRPNLTVIGSAICRYADGGKGMDVETYCKDWKKMAQAAADAARAYRLDFIQIASDLLREAEGYGSKVTFFKDRLPTMTKPAIDNISGVDGLKPLKAKDIPRLYDLVLAAEYALKDPDIDPMVLAVGPMTVAGNIRGVEDFMVDMLDEPELCEKLLGIVSDTTVDFINCLAAVGVKYAYVADPVASLVSPAVYGRMVFPVHKKIFDAMKNAGITGRLHVCGNTAGIVRYTSTLGAAIVDVDHVVDFSAALASAEGRCLLNGNIDPVSDVYTATPEHTKQAMLAAADKINRARALFMPGCELPTDTKLENILAIHEAILEIGA